MNERQRLLYMAGVMFLLSLGLFAVGAAQHIRHVGEGEIWFFWSSAALVVAALSFEVALTIQHVERAHQETRRQILEKLDKGEVL